jgi:hypothetical protein
MPHPRLSLFVLFFSQCAFSSVFDTMGLTRFLPPSTFSIYVSSI